MPRCIICGSSVSSIIQTKEKRYSPNPDYSINVCSDCFSHLLINDFETLDKRVEFKLNHYQQKKSDLKDLNEAARQMKEAQENRE